MFLPSSQHVLSWRMHSDIITHLGSQLTAVARCQIGDRQEQLGDTSWRMRSDVFKHHADTGGHNMTIEGGEEGV
jgi:hypothetical protein